MTKKNPNGGATIRNFVLILRSNCTTTPGLEPGRQPDAAATIQQARLDCCGLNHIIFSLFKFKLVRSLKEFPAKTGCGIQIAVFCQAVSCLFLPGSVGTLTERRASRWLQRLNFRINKCLQQSSGSRSGHLDYPEGWQ
jgi:hypothetical protein